MQIDDRTEHKIVEMFHPQLAKCTSVLRKNLVPIDRPFFGVLVEAERTVYRELKAITEDEHR